MISVILPVYNGEAFVARAIQSVQQQTAADWELVAVDDGSQDGTLVILEQFAAQDKRIRVLSQPNGGVSAARNSAMAAAQGTYYAFLDADDLWYPEHLAVLEQLIAAYPQAGLFGTTYDILYPDGRLSDTTAYFQGKESVFCLSDFLGSYAEDKRAKCFALSSTCVRAASVHRAGGFCPACKIGEDLALTLQIAAFEPVVLCAHKTVRYCKAYSTATRTTSFDPDWYFFDQAQRLEADPLLLPNRRDSLHRVMAWFQLRRARHYLIDGRRQDAWTAFRQVKDYPGSMRDVLLTRLLFFLPCQVVRSVFLLRWQRQA